jgi:hypothetical protein
MRTWRIYQEVKDFLAQGLGGLLERIAAEGQVTVSPVKSFSIGWKDPFGLKDYNAVMIVPDTAKRVHAQRLDTITIAAVAALKARDVETLTDQMGLYADALGSLFEEDPSIGGAAFEASVDDVDFSLPTQGSPVIGVVTAIISVRMDQMQS